MRDGKSKQTEIHPYNIGMCCVSRDTRSPNGLYQKLDLNTYRVSKGISQGTSSLCLDCYIWRFLVLVLYINIFAGFLVKHLQNFTSRLIYYCQFKKKKRKRKSQREDECRQKSLPKRFARRKCIRVAISLHKMRRTHDAQTMYFQNIIAHTIIYLSFILSCFDIKTYSYCIRWKYARKSLRSCSTTLHFVRNVFSILFTSSVSLKRRGGHVYSPIMQWLYSDVDPPIPAKPKL